jgi:hypothetical protein
VNCPEEAVILAYAAGRASEEEQIVVDEHVCLCMVCSARVRALLSLREDFDSVWDTWTAARHGNAHRAAIVAEALEKLAREKPSLAARARSWLLDTCQGVGERTLRVLVDRAKGIALMAADVLPEGCALLRCSPVAGFGSPDKETQAHLEQGGELLVRGQIAAAEREMEAAAAVDARLARAATCEVLRAGRRQAVACVDSTHGTLWIRVWPEKGLASPAFALMYSTQNPSGVHTAEFASVRGEDFVVAEFTNVPDGPFCVLW